MTNQILFSLVLATAIGACLGVIVGAEHAHGDEPQTPATTFDIPHSLKVEHEELHRELSAATKVPGRTGAAALRVAKLLHAHFASEEEYAMPPLALLGPLSSGRISPDMREVIAMTDRLKADLPRMLDEHKAIVMALEDLARAAKIEGHPDVVRFADKLTLHAENEEQVLYPAAVLVGEFLKMKFPS